ncbi:PE family protein [Mycobacterium sp. SWH-M3]|nr:PE family protein [Mycobacterium sp. SWH-M3]
MQLDVTPEALGAASAQVGALTARLVAANAAHAVATGMILPPGSDLPSIKTSASLIAKGASHEVEAAMGNTQLAGTSFGAAESSTSYAIGEGEGVAIYTAAGGVAV